MEVIYENEIKSVYMDDICVGFICRRSMVFGYMQEIPNYWIATTTLAAPEWEGGFEARKDARAWLWEQYQIRMRNAS